MAPRVHNSGHWTIEGAITSQFENHVRAVADLPLGRAGMRGAAAMVNLIGSVPPIEALLDLPGAHVHLYGKEPKPGRKVGHVTVVAKDHDELMPIVDRLREIVAESTAAAPPPAPLVR
jgi:5-(carboxyamino)imidazole ribonucleotide synthase